MPKLKIRVDIRGWSSKRASKKIKRRLIRRISGVTTEAAEQLRREALHLMKQSKSGRHHVGLPRRSSARGEAPASQSGALADSFRITSQGQHRLHRRVGTGLWYGNFLMMKRDRPLLLPALHKVLPDYVKEVKNMIGREL